MDRSIEMKILQPIFGILVTFDLSFASTETKYIKLKTKTQNNLLFWEFFIKNYVIILAFFETN